jgi:Na+/H+-dicarboxylate symporter
MSWWIKIPLYLRILAGLFLGFLVGEVVGDRQIGGLGVETLAIPSRLVLRLLGALAPALILFAIVQALLNTHFEKGTSGRLIRLLILNTLVAISIGLLVANVLKPGQHATLVPVSVAASDSHGSTSTDKPDIFQQFLDNVPKSLLGPLGDQGKVIGVIFIALAFGLALRKAADRPLHTVGDWVDVALKSLVTILHWVIEIVPLAVFGLVANIVGTQGLGAFVALGAFVLAVILALVLQALYYLLRIRLFSWVRPLHLIWATRDALVMAFSTSSSTITMPLTFECLKDRVGLRKKSASLGALVGANFNNDGTALYEAMAALFISQLLAAQGLGVELTLAQQLLVVLTSVVASVGAAGIPEAGLVTMALVFSSVGLPMEYIAFLLPVDWFLDRCRTVINVLGDMNVSCLLDGKTRGDSNLPD